MVHFNRVIHLKKLIEILERAISHLKDSVDSLRRADLLMTATDPGILGSLTAEPVLVPVPVPVSTRSAAMKRSWDRRKKGLMNPTE